MKKREFLKLMSASTVTVLVSSGVWRAYDNGVFSTGQGPAYEPWQTWRTEASEGPLALVQAAILAATPHNTQPWLFQVTQSQIKLYADTKRHLGAMDPYLREMHIGLGCAVENMLLAAKANGYQCQLTLAPGTLAAIPSAPQSQLVASLELSPGPSSASDLYEAIPKRHTNRAAYDRKRPVSTETLQTLQTLVQGDPELRVFLFTSAAERQKFAQATIQATEEIIADSVMAHDSHRWFRSSWQDLQQYKSGPHIDASGLPPGMRALVKMLPPVSEDTANNAWLGSTKTTLAAAPVLGFVAVRGLYDQPQSLRAGQLWQRMHLWATHQELAMQPINQLMERVDRERQLGKEPRTARSLAALMGDSTWKPTFAFRLGYPTEVGLASARRPVEEVLLSTGTG